MNIRIMTVGELLQSIPKRFDYSLVILKNEVATYVLSFLGLNNNKKHQQ